MVDDAHRMYNFAMDKDLPPSLAGLRATTTRGHTWHWPDEATPVVLAALDWTIPCKRRPRRNCHACWALDMETARDFRYHVPEASDQWHVRNPSHLHLYAPNTVYWEDDSQITASDMRSRFILFRSPMLPPLARLFADKHPSFAVLHDPHRQMQAIINQMIQLGFHHGQTAASRVQQLLWQLFDQFAHLEQVSERAFQPSDVSQQHQQGKSDFIELVHAFFRAQLSYPITLADLAKHLNMSASTISHRYRREAGQPPMSKLIEMRLDVAKGMLLKGYRLQQIAEQTGFHDGFHLSKTFKQHVGIAPATYRKQHDLPGHQ